MTHEPEPSPIAARPTSPAHRLAGDDEALFTAERLAADFLRDASTRDRERRLPWAELDAFSQSGLWAMNVPRAYGGPAVSYATVARVFAVLAAGDASIAQIAQNHVSLIDVVRFDPDESRKRFLMEAAVAGLRFGNALSERGGKTIFDMKTRLTRDGDTFVVSGQKFYSTGALYAHLVPVHAIDDDDKHKLVFVDRDAPGLEVIDDWSGFGQRTTGSGTVKLDRVRVSADRIVPAHLAFDTPSVHGAVAQIIHCGIDAGIAHRAIEETVAFVREHARPWADSGRDKASDDPFTLREIADLKVKLHAAEAVMTRAGKVIDAGLLDENAETAAAASIAVAEAQGTDHRDRPAGDEQAVRALRLALGAGVPQSRPALARRSRTHAARPGALEGVRDRRLRGQRHETAAAFVDMKMHLREVTAPLLLPLAGEGGPSKSGAARQGAPLAKRDGVAGGGRMRALVAALDGDRCRLSGNALIRRRFAPTPSPASGRRRNPGQ